MAVIMGNSENKYSIMVIDDDRKLRELLQKYLISEGFEVGTASGAVEARNIMSRNIPDLIVLDVMMPGENGISFVKWLRDKEENIPVLMLTAMGDVEERIRGLESGADDYLAKPFEPRELSIRIEKLLKRRSFVSQSGITKFGQFTLDPDRNVLLRDGRIIDISSTEIDLLKILSAQLNQCLSRNELSRKLNGISERSIDVQITRLRKKIEEDPANPVFIHTVRGRGYMLRDGI